MICLKCIFIKLSKIVYWLLRNKASQTAKDGCGKYSCHLSVPPSLRFVLVKPTVIRRFDGVTSPRYVPHYLVDLSIHLVINISLRSAYKCFKYSCWIIWMYTFICEKKDWCLVLTNDSKEREVSVCSYARVRKKFVCYKRACRLWALLTLFSTGIKNRRS